MICFFNTDAPYLVLGEMYDGIDNMLKNVSDVIMAKELVDPTERLCDKIKKKATKKWNKMTTPLHLST